MKGPLVSILMPMYNAAALVPDTLMSLQAQTYENWELIAIDDGSEDHTYDVVAGYPDERIRLVRKPENRGLPARLNEAVTLARGALFARMDADDIALPTRLERQVGFLLANPLVDVVATDMLVITQEGEPNGREKWRGSSHESVTGTPWSGFHFNHATWMGRAGWFRRHGYREDAVRTEDDDLLLRAYRTSRFHRLDEVLYAYRVGTFSSAAVWTARRSFIRSLCRESLRQRDPRLLLGVPLELLKAAAERVAEVTGLDHRLNGHRTGGLVAEEAEAEYRAMRASLSG
ncbi:MAG: glycosyltransferase involved in cell wall biosynthesis [Rhodothermales bacterium]